MKVQIVLFSLAILVSSQISIGRSLITPHYYLDSAVTKGTMITSYLHPQSDVFHFISHGRSGQLFVEGEWLGLEELLSLFEEMIPQSAQALYIYGCNFTVNQGRAIRQYFESALGIPVFTSDNITGAGGDWILDGRNSSVVLPIENYPYNLQASCTDEYLLIPEDFGFTSENFSGRTVNNVDISSRFNLPSNSIIVSLENGYAYDYDAGLGFTVTSTTVEPVTRFNFTGSVGVRIRVEHGALVNGRQHGEYVRDRFYSSDAFTLINSSLSSGLVAGHSGNQYYVENQTDDPISNSSGTIKWQSNSEVTPGQDISINTTNDIVNSGRFNNLIRVFVIPNYCDVVDYSLAYDIDCNEENGDQTLFLRAENYSAHPCLDYQWSTNNPSIAIPPNQINPEISIPNGTEYDGDYSFRVTSNGNTCDNQSIDVLPVACQALAIQKILFGLQEKEEGILLQWKIISDVPITQVILEKSWDGKNFEPFHQMNEWSELGQAIQSSYLDQSVNMDHVYYRIEAIDRKGNHAFSSVLNMLTEINRVKLYPNPAQERVQLVHLPSDPVEIHIFNSMGKLVFQDKKTVHRKDWELNLESLPRGMYFLQVKDQTIRLILK